jgi:uncharacterized protein (DUF488 family)
LLRGAAIELLVDVRIAPGSRKHPQFGKDALSASLNGAEIAYEWHKELGGFRKPRSDSRHTALRSSGFRGYADYMETPEFHEALSSLVERRRDRRTAVMCAESLWWRCHRRMIADALLVAGCDVVHLMSAGRREPHDLNPVGRVEGETLVYDVEVGQGDLLADEPRTKES